MAIAVLLAGLLSGPISVADPALAASLSDPSCPSYNPSFVGWLWTRSTNDIYGIRAPVETRFDGLLCTNSTGGGLATGWIAIQTQNASEITQAGIIHVFENGSPRWCRVWAIGTGIPHFYDCGAQSDGTYVYFQIQQYYDPVTHQHLYDIYDCGTGGGYGSCTSLNASQMAYSNPEGVVAAETNYGCTVRIMGSASAPQHYGSNANPVEGFVTVWATRSPWSYVSSANVCPTDYHGALVTGGMVTWDSRN